MTKISPKTAFFRFSQKLSNERHFRFERNFRQSFYTLLESDMSNGIKIVWLGCEKHSQKWPKNSHFPKFFSILSKTIHTIRTKISTILQSFYTILWSFMWISLNSFCWDVRNIAKINPKIAKRQHFSTFFDFRKNCPSDSNENLYTIVWSYVCNSNKFVWLGLERVRRKKTYADSFTANAALVQIFNRVEYVPMQLTSTTMRFRCFWSKLPGKLFDVLNN